MTIKQIISNKLFIILCLLLVMIDLFYTITFSYDSGHYFSYFKVLDGDLPWTNWDPVRGITFPLYLRTITIIFGQSINSLLIPAILFHLLLFLISSYFVLGSTFYPNSDSKKKANLLLFLTFAFIGIDPLILGYFHAVLTEYLASSIAMISCLLSYLLYKTVIRTGKIDYGFFIVFSILVAFSWHMKQPYVGAALFPLLLVSVIMMLDKKWSLRLQIIVGNILVVTFLVSTIFIWDQILPNKGLAYDQTRTSKAYIDGIYTHNVGLINRSLKEFLGSAKDNYFALANLYNYDPRTKIIEKSFSVTRAVQTERYGYRIFNYGSTNMVLPPVYPDAYMENIRFYVSNYYPPIYLNNILKFTTPKSTVLFSSLYLILPLVFLVVFSFIIFAKHRPPWLIFIYICSGSAFMNAVEHALLNNPIDRYLIWGYPLLLVSIIVSLLVLYDNGAKSLKKLNGTLAIRRLNN